jgi:hypothetical protein
VQLQAGMPQLPSFTTAYSYVVDAQLDANNSDPTRASATAAMYLNYNPWQKALQAGSAARKNALLLHV